MTWEQMEKAIAFLTESAAKHDAQIGQLIEATNQDARNIREMAGHIQELVRLAEIQNERITRLEGDERE
jgi:hypothetical protein